MNARRRLRLLRRLSKCEIVAFNKLNKSPNHGKRGPGKATKNAREAIALLVEGNIPRMQGWLDEIAQTEGPMAAWRCLQDVIEYHVPKLQRTELTGADGSPFVVEIKRFSDDAPDTTR